MTTRDSFPHTLPCPLPVTVTPFVTLFPPSCRRLRGLATAATLLSLAACERPVSEVGGAKRGMARGPALRALVGGKADLVDTLRLIYHRSSYLVQGERLEVLYYAPDPIPSDKDAFRDGLLTPIIVQRDTVRGLGWKDLKELGKKHNLALPKTE